jgi:putative peptidoglycan lipid II flippase
MGLASVLLGGSILLSRFTGLARDKIISYLFGATSESDLYFAAFVIPDFINYLLAGAYFSITLIPLLATHFDRDREDGWRFFSAVFTWTAVAITAVTLIAMVYARELAHAAAPGMDAAALERLARFLRIIMPGQVFFLTGSCMSALLYLRRQFLVPALTPIVYNAAIIIGGVALRHRGMEGFCWGVLAGAFIGNFLLPCLAARYGGGLHLRFTLFHPGLKGFMVLALPLMLGQSIVVLDEQFIRIFGSMAGTSVISWLNYARRIMLAPVGVVAQAAGVASYPFLSELIAKKDYPLFDRTINAALRNTLVLLIPMSLWMIAASDPIIRLIFQQGGFTASDTANTARLLMIFLSVIACWGFQQILGRGFYARRDTLTPAVIGTLATLASIPLFFLLTRLLHAQGVALASSLAISLYALALGLWWRRRFGSNAFSGLGAVVWRTTLCSAVAAVPALCVGELSPIGKTAHPYLSSIFSIVSSGCVFAVVFALIAPRLAPDALEPFLAKGGPLAARLLGRLSRGAGKLKGD